MRAWKAVALVNVALACVAIAAWTAWQRQQAAAAPTIAAAAPEREWRDVAGVVRAVVPELGIVVLTHADIPGYMPGMTMGFRAVGVEIPETLSVGDEVRFTVRGSPPVVVLTAIEKAP